MHPCKGLNFLFKFFKNIQNIVNPKDAVFKYIYPSQNQYTMTNLDIVKQYYNHFNSQNWQGMLDLVSDDIQHFPNEGKLRAGKVLFTEFLQSMDTAYEEQLSEITFYSTEDLSKVAAQFTVSGIYKIGDEGFPEAHGQKYVLPAAAFLVVENGKISSVTTYYNLQEWIELVS